tara:strand:- start:991 stop:1311 length:321 start_codon:yes stop_codon:yes gene_type:complete
MEIDNIELKDALGNPAMIPGPDNQPEKLLLFTAARTVLWNMPVGDLTMGDSELARNVLQGMSSAEKNGNIWNPDDELLTWTVKQLRAHAPKVFGINAICVLEGFEQ